MSAKKKLKVGDKIVRLGRVYKIFKSEKRKKGKSWEKIIFFKPFFKRQGRRTLVCSIPAKNIEKTGIRRLFTKKKLQKILTELGKKSTVKTSLGVAQAKKILKENNPYKTARVLKYFWLDKHDESTNFTKSRKDVFKMAMRRLVEEVAFVKSISLTKAKKKIRKTLEKALKRVKK